MPTMAEGTTERTAVAHAGLKAHTSFTNIVVSISSFTPCERRCQDKIKVADCEQLICAAALASYNYGYSNNVVAGTLAQVTFNQKFLSGSNANMLIDSIVSG